MTVHDDMWSAGRLLLEATHGRAATWTKQTSGATTAVTARTKLLGPGVMEVALKASALSAAPLRDDSIVLTGSSVRWYVSEPTEVIGLGGDYVVVCRSNEAR